MRSMSVFVHVRGRWRGNRGVRWAPAVSPQPTRPRLRSTRAMASSYTFVTHDRSGHEHARPYTSSERLAPGSVVLLGGRYWLVERVDDANVQARPARYRLTLRHIDGHEEPGAFRRFRADAPT